jgi:hypothetical protein
MKLTKGKIKKYLLKHAQTKKKYNISKTRIKSNTYKKRPVLNLKNKTIKQ